MTPRPPDFVLTDDALIIAPLEFVIPLPPPVTPQEQEVNARAARAGERALPSVPVAIRDINMRAVRIYSPDTGRPNGFCLFWGQHGLQGEVVGDGSLLRLFTVRNIVAGSGMRSAVVIVNARTFEHVLHRWCDVLWAEHEDAIDRQWREGDDASDTE